MVGIRTPARGSGFAGPRFSRRLRAPADPAYRLLRIDSMSLEGSRPIWKSRTFWLVLVAVMFPLGWLVLVWEAGRTAVSARGARPSELPADVVEWLRMRDLERERLRPRPTGAPTAASKR